MDLTHTLAVANRQGLTLDAKAQELIAQYRTKLYETNEKTNLTRIPIEQFDLRHSADSLLIAEACPHGSSVLDIGSGPGFPAWILAAARPDLLVTAIESQGKMIRMLKSVFVPNLQVLEQRAEDNVQREAFEILTGRAIAPFPVQIEISAPWLALGGLFVPFRTLSEKDEIKKFNAGQLGLELENLIEREIPGSDIVRLFPVYRKVRETPEEFPRPWGRVKSRPLGQPRPKA